MTVGERGNFRQNSPSNAPRGGVNPRQENHNYYCYYNKAILTLISKQTHFSSPLTTTRNKVNYAFIDDDSKRKISYNKRLKGLLKKSDELKTLCDVEVATVIYGTYRNEPYTFPNNDVVRNTFIKFKELATLDRSKNMVTREEFTMQRIKKLEEQLQNVRKENRVKEMTNEMYEVFERKAISVDMNPSYLNDLRCVIKKNLKQVRELTNVSSNGSTIFFSNASTHGYWKNTWTDPSNAVNNNVFSDSFTNDGFSIAFTND
uniref:Type I MADS box transcription factor n=1 Tax=Solanum tuberosum TaxID=4113 RepID=M1DN38_SOLTU